MQFIFLLVKIGVGIWVITFLYGKHAKLNDFLICVQKFQTTLIMKQRERNETAEYKVSDYKFKNEY